MISTSDYETNIAEKKYQMQDSYGAYTGAERKLQQSESQVFYLKHYINTKSKDTNFEDIKNECMSVADQLNKMLLKWMNDGKLIKFNLYKSIMILSVQVLHFIILEETSSLNLNQEARSGIFSKTFLSKISQVHQWAIKESRNKFIFNFHF